VLTIALGLCSHLDTLTPLPRCGAVQSPQHQPTLLSIAGWVQLMLPKPSSY